MKPNRENVKTINAALALGFSLTEAIQRALGRTLSEFAREHDTTVQAVSMCLRAYPGRPYPDIRDWLCNDLGVGREYLDRLIEQEAEATEGAA